MEYYYIILKRISPVTEVSIMELVVGSINPYVISLATFRLSSLKRDKLFLSQKRRLHRRKRCPRRN
jgi:hypothetical protein